MILSPEKNNDLLGTLVEFAYAEYGSALEMLAAAKRAKSPKLKIGATQRPYGFVEIWVKDFGEGISEIDQKRLFTAHTRLRKVRARGEGLGLSIVKRIIHNCGGEVGVESELGKGSKFWFTLPEATSADMNTSYDDHEAEQIASTPGI